MSKLSQHREKNGHGSEIPQDVFSDGTSARTRPLSFDEVMLRRKCKDKTTRNNIVPEEAHYMPKGDDIEVAEAVELNTAKHNNSVPQGMDQALEELQRVKSKRRENAPVKEDKLGRDAYHNSQKPKSYQNGLRSQIVCNDEIMEQKTDRRVREKDEYPRDDLRRERVKKHHENLERKDRSPERHRGKYEEEKKSSQLARDDDWQMHSKRKKDNQLSNDLEKQTRKRDSKDLTGSDKHADRSRGKSEKGTKGKYHIEDEERVREPKEIRNRDTGRRQNADFPEKKEKKSPITRVESKLNKRRSRSRERDKDRSKRSSSPKLHNEESKSKRRRSRSREGDKDRVRRSSSPKISKHTSYYARENQESATYSSKDRSGGLRSDTDRRRTSTNGSSSHYRRHAGSSSGLGGYSPRKRKSEAAARTPSPIRRSPEKRTPGWDLNISGKGSSGAGVPSQIEPLSKQELHSVIPITPTTSKPITVSCNVVPLKVNAVDSIQLTQATRPMRRLYVENLPASASEKALMEWINDSLLSSGINHIQGSQPCLSCMINKEKGQALLEFLTPEDASAAVLFDGRSFIGTKLKFRRPKDFSDVTTGVMEKSVDSGDSISDVVEDSPHKIFIGGISKIVSSEMLKEITRTFGALKAYHFEDNADTKESYAFLEYVDHSVTLKACASLDGIKLGGQVLTVVQAIPDDSQEVNAGNKPFYGIPEHSKPLLQKPTQVLKLKDVFNPEDLLSMSEAEVNEILEDVRIECSRFGTVRSINYVKQTDASTTSDSSKLMDGGACAENHSIRESENDDREPEKAGKSEPPCSGEDVEADNMTSEGRSSEVKPGTPDLSSNQSMEPEGNTNSVVSDNHASDPLQDEKRDIKIGDRNPDVEEPSCLGAPKVNQPNENCNDIAKPTVEGQETGRVAPVEEETHKEEQSGDMKNAGTPDKGRGGTETEPASSFAEIFEPGCVVVEFKREEASCEAAHCLHRRLFDNRVVTVEYVHLDDYRRRFFS